MYSDKPQALLGFGLKKTPAPLQVSDPECHDYDKRTPL
jgi:hypothetical protein